MQGQIKLNFNGVDAAPPYYEQIDLSADVQRLEEWSADAQDYLYQVEPKSSNLFCVSGFREAGGIDDTSNLVRPFFNFAYRVQSISFGMPSMEFEYNKITRQPHPKSINYPNTIHIDYFEDVYHSVRALHFAWWQRWYNREFDCWRTGAQGKFRAFRLVAFHYVNDVSLGTSALPIPRIQPIFAIDFSGVAPKTLGNDWKWDYSSTGNAEFLGVDYIVSKMRFYYTSEFQDVDANKDANVSAEKMKYEKGQPGAWKPAGFRQDGDSHDEPTTSRENTRIVRSSTTSMSGDTAMQ